eukprot:TRINITY_DN90411_c0_g1_i1.p1 TRINITY_DN90411_c0_g1~~TRINITY_DN90411_c0_g1_i1.p1  ORF type:complete len:406 (-),score=53.03 TRINITY_DN90411_c0_g1_i1:834-1976(-)
MPVEVNGDVHEPLSCEAHDLPAEALAIGGVPFEGDYYHRDEACIWRGVTLPAGHLEGYDSLSSCREQVPAVYDRSADADFVRSAAVDLDLNCEAHDKTIAKGRLGSEHVDLPIAARPLRQDTKGLPPSSFLLSLSQVEALAVLERYFNSEEIARITKVRPAKGCLTVLVSHHGGHWSAQCEIKIRLYPTCAQEIQAGFSHGLAVVFERRAGDGLAFAEVFRRARASLQAHSTSVLPPAEVPAPFSTNTTSVDNVMLEDMQPIMDMMSDLQPASAQIAALNALATYAATPTQKMPAIICEALRSNESAFANLLKKNAFEFAGLGALVAATLPAESFSACFAMVLLGIASDRVHEGMVEQKIRACWATVLMNVVSQLRRTTM